MNVYINGQLQGGGGGSLPDTPASVLLDAASPNTFVGLDGTGAGQALTPSASLTRLGLVDTPSLASATGWTLVDGVGTAAITGGVARLTLGAAIVPGAWANHPKIARQSLLSPLSCDFRCRVKSWTGGDSNDALLAIGLRTGAASEEGLYATIRGNGSRVWLDSNVVSGGGTLGFIALDRATVAGGQFWVRLIIAGGSAALFYGVGVSGVEPSNWLIVHSTTNTTNWQSQYLAQITLSLDGKTPGSPDAVAVDIDGISVRDLGVP